MMEQKERYPNHSCGDYSGHKSTLALAITFSSCSCVPLSSPLLMTPGNMTQLTSLWARASSSSPPTSSMVVGLNRALNGACMLNAARCDASWRERSAALTTRARSAWASREGAGADNPGIGAGARVADDVETEAVADPESGVVAERVGDGIAVVMSIIEEVEEAVIESRMRLMRETMASIDLSASGCMFSAAASRRSIVRVAALQ
jgi:hypothetical protein